MKRNVLFRSGIHPRLLAAAAFATIAFGSVALMTRPQTSERTGVGESTDAGDAPVKMPPVRIEIESVRPVETWRVVHGGRALEPALASPHVWEATIPASAEAPRSTLSILAVAATDSGASNALHLRVFVGESLRPVIDRTEWCSSTDCVVEFQLADAAR